MQALSRKFEVTEEKCTKLCSLLSVFLQNDQVWRVMLAHLAFISVYYVLQSTIYLFRIVLKWPTVYSSSSLSNLEPGTSSSSVRTVKDGSEQSVKDSGNSTF